MKHSHQHALLTSNKALILCLSRYSCTSIVRFDAAIAKPRSANTEESWICVKDNGISMLGIRRASPVCRLVWLRGRSLLQHCSRNNARTFSGLVNRLVSRLAGCF